MTVAGVAVVGAGAVGRRFLDLFDEHPAFRVVSVADSDPDVLARSARPERLAIADVGEAVGAGGVDLVYVAVPPASHAAVVRLALEHDRALLCEKPLGVDVGQSRDLVRDVEQRGLPAAVNFVHSAAPAARALADLLTSPGTTAARVEVLVDLPQWPRPFQAHARWLAERAEGGPTREVLSHFLFLAQRLVGGLELRSSEVSHPDGPDGVLAEAAVTARFTSSAGVDVAVRLRTGTSAERTELVVHTSGVDGARQLVVRDFYRLLRREGDVEQALLPEGADTPRAAYLAQLDDVAALLAGRPHRCASFAEALAVQVLVEGLLS
jgi:predicted dehydrogenase